MTENSSVDTDQTDNDSIECFQNYTASEVFIQGLAGLVDQQDVESMIRAQKQILQRFEKTNEMLSNCNTLSVTRLKVANQQFKNYKQLLIDIKKDLDYTFKKINVLKTKLQSQYPESVAATTSKLDESVPDLKESEEQQPTKLTEEDSSSTDKNAKETEVVKSSNNADSDTKFLLLEQLNKKIEISDSNSSESGEADSQIESISISTSDTA